MSTTMTSGFFPVETGTAALLVKVQVYVSNLGSTPGTANVTAVRNVDGCKQSILNSQLHVPANDRRMLETGADEVAGEDVEITVTLPTQDSQPSGLVPGAAVVETFTGDGSTTLLHWISAGDFVPVSGDA